VLGNASRNSQGTYRGDDDRRTERADATERHWRRRRTSSDARNPRLEAGIWSGVGVETSWRVSAALKSKLGRAIAKYQCNGTYTLLRSVSEPRLSGD